MTDGAGIWEVPNQKQKPPKVTEAHRELQMKFEAPHSQAGQAERTWEPPPQAPGRPPPSTGPSPASPLPEASPRGWAGLGRGSAAPPARSGGPVSASSDHATRAGAASAPGWAPGGQRDDSAARRRRRRGALPAAPASLLRAGAAGAGGGVGGRGARAGLGRRRAASKSGARRLEPCGSERAANGSDSPRRGAGRGARGASAEGEGNREGGGGRTSQAQMSSRGPRRRWRRRLLPHSAAKQTRRRAEQSGAEAQPSPASAPGGGRGDFSPCSFANIPCEMARYPERLEVEAPDELRDLTPFPQRPWGKPMAQTSKPHEIAAVPKPPALPSPISPY
ncbi:translation initiation factor IF-2-like [Monodelphis domestica]|uniref:translation initiation factor IF-2-like n=1 Tax=Monodelphis domestica TaxID=13616 RepID=UPI0024E1E9B2|nr:translation initiation factor IF-2-like [Monodelphis domestica]